MSSESQIDGKEFRRVLGQFPTGVTVVTAVTDDGPAGITIGSFTSVSLDPPLVMWCPSCDSPSWERMRSGASFCVNVLGDHQADVSNTFASTVEDKFSGIDTRVEATGAPVIEGSLAWIDCEYHAIHDGGDHDIVVGVVRAMGTDDTESGPLIFFRGGYGRFEAI